MTKTFEQAIADDEVAQLELFPADTNFDLTPPSKYIYDGLGLHFKIPYPDKVMECFGFVDGLMSAVMGRPIISVIKFDKYLMTTHYPEYTGDNMSMSEAVIKFYGIEADNWLRKHIC